MEHLKANGHTILYSVLGVSLSALHSQALILLSCASECVSRVSHHNAEVAKGCQYWKNTPIDFFNRVASFNYLSEKPHALSVALPTWLFVESSCGRSESSVTGSEVGVGEIWQHINPVFKMKSSLFTTFCIFKGMPNVFFSHVTTLKGCWMHLVFGVC